MAIVPEPKEKPLPFKEEDDWFSCDCGTQDHGLMVTLMDERMAILEMHDNTFMNIPWHWRLWRATKLFWEAYWNHTHTLEVVLNQKEHKRFKAFANTLKDERCRDCNPDYLEGKGRYYQHGH